LTSVRAAANNQGLTAAPAHVGAGKRIAVAFTGEITDENEQDEFHQGEHQHAHGNVMAEETDHLGGLGAGNEAYRRLARRL
jgi:hypothetical protein